MADPRRLPHSNPADGADRDGRVDTLLVDGLDRYFAGDYDGAIHLWTRVLFLDRTHARARAYINRARTALAERQRRADELLHRADDALAGGDAESARAFVAQAVAARGDDERVAALRLQIDRWDRVRTERPGPRRAAAVVDVVPIRHASRRRWPIAAAVALAVAAFLAGVVGRPILRDWLGLASADQAQMARTGVSASDTALQEARDLYARGRLQEAVRALDRVDPQSGNRPLADDLRERIRRLLATGLAAPPPAPDPSPAGRP